MVRAVRLLLAPLAGFSIVLAACASPTPTAAPSLGGAPTELPAASTSGPLTGSAIVGNFDVGGHSLYINCEGQGQPTVVYMHGAIFNSSDDPHENGRAIQRMLNDDFRVCLYDRRNVGHSDPVDAEQTSADAISDLHLLLDAADIGPPYVLLGASFGGLLAYLYLNTYPDEVVGLVQLDSPFPDEMELDDLLPAEDRYEAYDREDAQNSLERISHLLAHIDALPFVGKEPQVPMTYLASLEEPWNETGVPDYDVQIMDLLKSYVHRFSPGTFVEVDSPHFMEPAIPGDIVDAIRDVITEAGY